MTPEESLKVLSVFVILIVSFAGISIPVYLVRVDNVRVKFAFDMLRCISIGLILGVALLHMLPEANGILTTAESVKPPVPESHNQTIQELQGELAASQSDSDAEPYPYAFLFAALGVCLMLFLEQVTEQLAEHTPKADPNTKSESSTSGNTTPTDIEAQSHEGHNHAAGDLHSHHDATLNVANSKEARLKAYMIEISISLHSILVGVGLGVLHDYSDIEILLIALCFHQLFEGIALGGAVLRANQSKWFLASLVFFFSFSCPLGVAIGAGIANSFDPDDVAGLWTEGILYSIACGTLLYIGLYDLMGQSFQKKNAGMKKFGMVLAVGLGVSLMALLAVWA